MGEAYRAEKEKIMRYDEEPVNNLHSIRPEDVPPEKFEAGLNLEQFTLCAEAHLKAMGDDNSTLSDPSTIIATVEVKLDEVYGCRELVPGH